MNGHSHFVSDVVISSDGQFCLSGSWDGTLRLWDLASGNTTRRFIGHTKDVLSVAFSADNRQIVSAARDRTIKLWNTLGICKYTIQEQGHTEWVSCVRFSPLAQNPVIVSSGWDKLVKVWNLSNCKLKRDYHGHSGYLNTVTVSPDGSLCASGGRDGKTQFKSTLLLPNQKHRFQSTLERSVKLVLLESTMKISIVYIAADSNLLATLIAFLSGFRLLQACEPLSKCSFDPVNRLSGHLLQSASYTDWYFLLLTLFFRYRQIVGFGLRRGQATPHFGLW